MLKFTGERIVPEADNCETSFAFKMYQEHIARYHFSSFFCEGKRILDVGCGVGYGVNYLANSVDCNIVAFDISEQAIDHAKRFYNHKRIDYKVDTAESFDFNEKFDIITCFELIEHVNNQDFVLKSIKNSLKKDGILIISTPLALAEKRSAYHTTEFSFDGFKAFLSNYFVNIKFYNERNHFCSLICEDSPREMLDIVNLQNDFSHNTADYFIAVASDGKIDKLTRAGCIVINDDKYVKTLESDRIILSRDVEEFEKKIDILNNNLKEKHQLTVEISSELSRKIEYINVIENRLRDVESYQKELENDLRAKDEYIEKIRKTLAYKTYKKLKNIKMRIFSDVNS